MSLVAEKAREATEEEVKMDEKERKAAGNKERERLKYQKTVICGISKAARKGINL